jgi:8-oxo-dGTP diphosphatase
MSNPNSEHNHLADRSNGDCPLPRDNTMTVQKNGVVAVISQEGKLLLIRRAEHVAAPGKYCFPGGAIEVGETEEAALIRELREELGVDVEPIRRLWESITPWGVHLTWWKARLASEARFKPDPNEVAEVFWMTPADVFATSELLDSNRQFMERVLSGEICLDSGDG